MSEIDVEAVDDIEAPEGVEAPEYVLYGGKGGVGKTTCAAATALASARDGTPTLVVSTDPAHSLSDTLETEVPPEPARIREDVPLYGAEIDPEAAAEEGPFGTGGELGGLDQLLGSGGGGAGAGPLGGDGGPLGGDGGPRGGDGGPLGGDGGLFGGGDAAAGAADEAGDVDPTSIANSMPGADEAAALRLLIRYADDDRFERVVVDTAPTGHTLRLLELPEAMDSMLGKLLTLRERLSGLLDGLGGLFGGDDGPDEPAADAEQDLEALRERIERLRETLRDPEQTDFRIVMVPEELSIVESERLLARLAEYGIPVRTIVVNRVMQDLSDVVDDAHAAHAVGPNLDDCEFCARRWEVQQEALARAQDIFRGHDVRRVPLLADEVHGEAQLGIVAACLD